MSVLHGDVLSPWPVQLSLFMDHRPVSEGTSEALWQEVAVSPLLAGSVMIFLLGAQLLSPMLLLGRRWQRLGVVLLLAYHGVLGVLYGGWGVEAVLLLIGAWWLGPVAPIALPADAWRGVRWLVVIAATVALLVPFSTGQRGGEARDVVSHTSHHAMDAFGPMRLGDTLADGCDLVSLEVDLAVAHELRKAHEGEKYRGMMQRKMKKKKETRRERVMAAWAGELPRLLAFLADDARRHALLL